MGRSILVGVVTMALVMACDSSTTGSGGTGGGTSPGKASIEFTVAGPDSYCMTSTCGQGPTIDIKDSSGHSLFGIAAGCSSVACETCTTSPCPGFACQERGIEVTGAKLDWDGAHNTTSTCGSGTSCVETSYAPPGKYTATMCATPGKLTAPDAGMQQCVASGAARCGSVEFDFPSDTVVKGTVAP